MCLFRLCALISVISHSCLKKVLQLNRTITVRKILKISGAGREKMGSWALDEFKLILASL